MKKYAIISPHLDDGILSCGDYISKMIEEGNEVTNITVFTGFPRSKDLSEAAKTYHAACFLSDDSMKYRKLEDIQACNLLGCKYIHLNHYECLYRKNQYGKNIYPNLYDIYHLEEEYDRFYIDKLIFEMSIILKKYDYILAPLGLGNHADHLLLNKVMKTIANIKKFEVFFYEEIPYICSMHDLNKEINILGMKPLVIEVSEKQWKLKTKSILFYRSQLHIMWENENERIKQLSAVTSAYKFKHAIRLWQMEENNDCL